ncbi:TPA: hypothetical protein U1711_000801 [Streptococcus suis]|nr:hypothetical protein [Streptococcus suis]NQQ87065.1 hypothetical protein [Streptococcus suis]HEM5625978.1 hypothetical protein [Streptococcus suis]
MPEYYAKEGFMKPVKWLTIALECIQELYDEEQIEDRENAELLIESPRKEEVE